MQTILRFASLFCLWLLSSAAMAGTFDGFYLGSGLSYGNLDNETTLSTAPLTYSENMASEGVGYYLFAGYGRTFNRWYLGAELEYNRTDGIDDNTSGILNIHELDWGVSLRLGYLLRNDLAVYGRLGLVHAEHDYYIETFHDSDTGLMAGLGVEGHLGAGWSLRGEYVYTDHGFSDSVDIPSLTGSTNTDTRGGMFRAALAYTFSAPEKSRPLTTTNPGNAFNGFYAGGLGAYANTEQDRAIFSPAGSITALSGGAWGVFAGYGRTWQQWYFGGEVEYMDMDDVEGSLAMVIDNNTLATTVSHEDAWGLVARAGRLLTDSAMVYVRGGVVRTETEFRVPLYGVRTDSEDWGYQLGVGLEGAFARNWTARGEYVFQHSEHEYPSFGGISTHVETGMFRGGVAYTF